MIQLGKLFTKLAKTISLNSNFHIEFHIINFWAQFYKLGLFFIFKLIEKDKMMSKIRKNQKQKFQKEKIRWMIPLSRKNFTIFGIGLFLLIIGFYLMTIPPWDSVYALVISPLILILAYFVIFPLGILKKK